MKILVVDDDHSTRRLLTTILARHNHQVSDAAHGQAAWEMLQSEHYPCVIADWMMPIVDGPELARRIRAANFPAYVYFILLTARSNREDIVRGLESGADDYLTKPFNPDELRARVAIADRIIDLETRLREANQRLVVMATRDSLTGMLNRRALIEIAERDLARAKREKSPVSLVMLDLDNFKAVNDAHGHVVGDQALCLVASLVTNNKRMYDSAGRWGGEEFLVVLPGADEAEAVSVAERMREEIVTSNLHLNGGGALTLGASFGVACTDDGEMGFDELIQRADEAMYRAKHCGRNRVVAYSLNC